MMLYKNIFSKVNQANIRYLIIGGIAVNLYDYYRATGDLDIILDMQNNNLENFINVVKLLNLSPRIPIKIQDILSEQIRNHWFEGLKKIKKFGLN